MKNILYLFLISCALSSCSTQKEEAEIVYIYKNWDKTSPSEQSSYTDHLSPQKIISYINSAKEDDHINENYITADALVKIIQTIERGGSQKKQAWKALERLSSYFDGEWGGYYETMCFELASSTIPQKEWLAFIQKHNGGFKSYEEVKQSTIDSYLRDKDNALSRVNYHQSRTDLSASEQAIRVKNARESYRIAQESYEKCLKVFGES